MPLKARDRCETEHLVAVLRDSAVSERWVARGVVREFTEAHHLFQGADLETRGTGRA